MPTGSHDPVSETQVLRKLYLVSRTLTEKKTATELLEFILDAAIELTRADRGFLILIDPKTAMMDVKLGRTQDRKNLVDAAWKVSKAVVLEAAGTGQSIVVKNARVDEGLQHSGSVQKLQLMSVAVAPLRLQGTVVGVLYLDNRYVEDLFPKHRVMVLETFANQAALALKLAGVVV